MTEAEKAQLRYIQIMRQSTEWQTDMAKTLMSPANAIRIIKQQFTLLARAIGNVLIPILMAAIPYVMVLTKWLTSLASKLAKVIERIFGIKLDFNYDREITGLGGISDGITDIGNAAGKTTKKLNTMLAPFDDLNVVQNELDKNGGGAGDLLGGGDLGVDLPEYDALAGLTDKFKKNMAEAEKNLKKILPVLGAVGVALGLWKIGKPVLEFFRLFSGNGSSTLTSGISKVSSALGVSKLGLAGIIASLVVSITAAIKSIPKFSKLLKDLAINGKSLSEATKDWTFLDRLSVGITLAPGNTLGRIITGFGLLKENIDMLKSKSVQSKNVMDELGNSISKVTRKKLEPLVNEFEQLNNKIVEIDLSSKIITEEDVNSIKNNLSEISKSIISELDTKQNKQLGNLKTLEKSLGADKTKEIIDKTKKYYEEQKTTFTSKEKEINDILKKASEENRTLTEEEKQRIVELKQQMMDESIQTITDKGDEYYKIMSQLTNNSVSLSIEQASEFIKNAQKTRDKTIKAAEEQRDGVIAEAYKMKEAGTITDEEYESIRKAAEDTYKSTVDSANKQYDEIYKKTTEKLGDSAKYIDTKTGEIKSHWSLFTENLKTKFSNSLDSLKTTAKTKLAQLGEKFLNWKATLKTPHLRWETDGIKAKGVIKSILETLNLPTSLPKLHVDWYAEGGYPSSGDLFFANENGIPEMVGRIGNRTAVANQDQITTSITNAVIQGMLQSGMTDRQQSQTVVYIGNKKVYEGYGEYAEGENDRYGTNMIRI